MSLSSIQRYKFWLRVMEGFALYIAGGWVLAGDGAVVLALRGWDRVGDELVVWGF